jgi:threonine/homoserine/homoserine lactone efflux protein
VFVAAAVALLVVPGPAVLYIVAQSIEHGRIAGLVSMLGIQVGGLVHVAAAALGLSALLVQSSVAFEIVKYAGAAYLVFLGLRKLLTRERFETTGERPPRQLDRLFAQGIVVNILNPKTALFFFAFLPQFVWSRKAPSASRSPCSGCSSSSSPWSATGSTPSSPARRLTGCAGAVCSCARSAGCPERSSSS